MLTSDCAGEIPRYGNVTYPFNGYGWEVQPKQETLLIRNATVWTSEAEGKLEGTDVLVRNGRIAQIGKNLSADAARIIDAVEQMLGSNEARCPEDGPFFGEPIGRARRSEARLLRYPVVMGRRGGRRKCRSAEGA